MTTYRLAVRPPYDWQALLAFFRLRAIVGVEYATEDTYHRTIVVAGSPSTMHVRLSPEGDALLVDAEHEAVATEARRMFDTELEPVKLAQHFASDDVIAPLVATRPGVRIPNGWNGYELAVRAVLGQQVTVIQAAKLAAKLVERYGRRIADDGQLTHVFPEPAAIVDQDIASLGMPGARGEAIRNVARAALEDPSIFAPGGSVEKLRGRRGIGEWTAQYIAMRALGDRDAFPASDVGLLRAMADKDGNRPTPKALLQRAEAWRPLRAYAAQHLWTSDGPNLTRATKQVRKRRRIPE